MTSHLYLNPYYQQMINYQTLLITQLGIAGQGKAVLYYLEGFVS